MAPTSSARIGQALGLLQAGLASFVAREFAKRYGGAALTEARRFMASEGPATDTPLESWDAAALLDLMWAAWEDVFRHILDSSERELIGQVRDVRNSWAREEEFSTDDACRALTLRADSASLRSWPAMSRDHIVERD